MASTDRVAHRGQRASADLLPAMLSTGLFVVVQPAVVRLVALMIMRFVPASDPQITTLTVALLLVAVRMIVCLVTFMSPVFFILGRFVSKAYRATGICLLALAALFRFDSSV